MKMNKKTIVLCMFLAVVLAAPAFPLMRKLMLSELAGNAEVIVTGKVVEKECMWNEKKTIIYTYVTISVDEYVKGEGEKEVVVRHLGGEVGRKGLIVGNMPRFREGEEVLVFLRDAEQALPLQVGVQEAEQALPLQVGVQEAEQALPLQGIGVYEVSGFAQGKYKIFTDGSGEKIVGNNFSNLCIHDEGEMRLLSEKTLPAKPLSEFISEIEEVMKSIGVRDDPEY